jgi:hypothetical protein
MQVAAGPSVIEAMRVLPPPQIDRDSASRSQPSANPYPKAEDWRAPSTMGRGQFIDLVV